jgi:uncharacterized protein (DUF2336 family)
MMDNPPHMILGQILNDPRIEVSGPLIENAVTIGERELLDLIDAGDAAKLRLIARRRKLTRAITARIVASGNASAMLTLVRNSHADIAHESFVSLTEAAQHDADLLAPLCTRADLPTPHAFELFWCAPSQLRRYLLSRFLTDSETLTKILKITLATQGGELAADAAIDVPKVTLALEHLEAGRSEEAIAIFAELAQITEATAIRIFNDVLGEPVIVLLKVLGMPRNELETVVHRIRHSPDAMMDVSRDIEELKPLFDTLSYNKAKILVTYWDWATQKTGPYALAH